VSLITTAVAVGLVIYSYMLRSKFDKAVEHNESRKLHDDFDNEPMAPQPPAVDITDKVLVSPAQKQLPAGKKKTMRV